MNIDSLIRTVRNAEKREDQSIGFFVGSLMEAVDEIETLQVKADLNELLQADLRQAVANRVDRLERMRARVEAGDETYLLSDLATALEEIDRLNGNTPSWAVTSGSSTEHWAPAQPITLDSTPSFAMPVEGALVWVAPSTTVEITVTTIGKETS